MTPQQRARVSMVVQQRKMLNPDGYGKSTFSPDAYMLGLIVSSEQLVSHVTNSNSQLFEAELLTRSSERKATSGAQGDFFCRLLMVDAALLDDTLRHHELHPAAELLIQKAIERSLFGSPHRRGFMGNSEWLSWYDTMNGCISAVRKNSRLAAFRKSQSSFELKVTKDFKLLKKHLQDSLKAEGDLKHVRFDLIYPKTGISGMDQIHWRFDRLVRDLLALLCELSHNPKRFIGAAWAIDYSSGGSYSVHVSSFFAVDKFPVQADSLASVIETIWKKITTKGSVHFPVNQWDQRGRFDGTGSLSWSSPDSKKALETTAFYMAMPATYSRLRLDGGRQAWGIHMP